MNGAPPLSAMLANRHLLRDANPGLIAWSEAQWRQWVLNRRHSPPDMTQPHVVVAADLTCLEDLSLHVGLMQLLAIAGVRCSVILAFPTEEMARVSRARARRECWEGIVTILNQAECERILSHLASHTVIARFLSPAFLPAEVEQAMATNEVPSSPGKDIFAGQSDAYRAWRDNETGPTDASELFGQLLTLNPDTLPSIPASTSFQNGSGNELEGDVSRAPRLRIELPEIAGDEELVITSSRGETVLRKSGALIDADRCLRIRSPAPLLLNEAQNLHVARYLVDGQVLRTDFPFHIPPSRLESWMVSAFLNRGGAGNPVIRAFSEGIGCRLAYAEDEPELLGDIPVVWGVLRDSDRILAQAKAQRLYFFYIDHAYFNRGHGRTYRITRNGYEAGPVRICPSDRADALGLELQPWRKDGREIIVCPPTEYFMQAHGCANWLEDTLDQLRSLTDRPVVVRNKPNPGEVSTPLPVALETAHALVTHSSNVAIEAVCLGTPVFVSSASAAAPVGRTDLADIDAPIYPDRDGWLAHLAYNQFSFEEISEGHAWRMLLELECRDLA